MGLKRLFYDIETSLGIYSTFGQGWNKTIGYKDEIVEPRIICICYKWQGEKKVHSIEWENGDDKKMIKKFIKVLEQADQICAHNGDGFDLPIIRGRAIKHGIDMHYDYQSIDTLKLARKRAGRGFKFQSNRLDYIAQYFGVGKKISTSLELWQRISYPVFIPNLYPMTSDYNKALNEMVRYCKMDVTVLEDVYMILNPYVKEKMHLGVMLGGNRWDCPKCASGDIQLNGVKYTAAGLRQQQIRCKKCKHQWVTSIKVVNEWQQWKMDRKLLNNRL